LLHLRWQSTIASPQSKRRQQEPVETGCMVIIQSAADEALHIRK